MRLKSFLIHNKRSVFLISLIGVLSFSFSSSLSILAYNYQDELLKLSFISWIGIFCIFSITLVGGLTPSTFLSIISGYFLWWYSVPYIIFSYMIALLISYFLAKKIDKGLFWDTFKNHKEVNRIQSNITKNELGVVMLARISPVLPFAIMNIILPIIGVSLKSFLIGGILGMLPRTLLSIWMGTQLNLLQETITSGKENQMYLYIVILLVIISIGGLLNYSMKILKK